MLTFLPEWRPMPVQPIDDFNVFWSTTLERGGAAVTASHDSTTSGTNYFLMLRRKNLMIVNPNIHR
jgi:hypothetical protein